MRKFRCAVSLILSLALMLECLMPVAVARDLVGGSGYDRTLEDIKSDMYAYYAASSDDAEISAAELPHSDSTTVQTATSETVSLLSGKSDDVELLSVVSSEASDFRYSVLDATHCAITGYIGSSTEVVIPAEIDGYSVLRISQDAFSGNRAITSVTIPEGVEEIRYYAFYNCTSLKTVIMPDSLAAIGYMAFGNCAALETITYPRGLSSLPGNTYNYQSGFIFSGCTSLTQITVPEGVTFLPAGVFKNCGPLKSVTLPSTLTSIGDEAFAGSGIISITVPDGVTYVGKGAFRGCTALTAIELPDTLTVIKSDSFSGCSSLKDVTLPAKLTEIEFHAFRDCGAMENLVLPDSLATIGYEAFRNCAALKSVTYPKGLNSIPGNTTYYQSGSIFAGCTSLAQITVPEGVTALPAGVFRGCGDLRSVILPSTLTTISDEAFTWSGITSITIPDSVTRVGNSAFYGCGALRTVQMSNTLSDLGSGAFQQCTSLTAIDLPDTLTVIRNNSFSGCSSLKAMTLPAELTEIEFQAFRDCATMESLILPDSVAAIGYEAFRNCAALKSVTYPKGLNSIPGNTTNYQSGSIFAGCKSLVQITIPEGVTSLPASVFSGCGDLRSVILPSTLTSIGDEAFIWSGITSITIPDDVTRIGNSAFYGCNQLRKVEITTTKANLNSISENCFYNCTSLTEISLPWGLQSIGRYAFGGCSSLVSVFMPDSVTSISAYAFNNCKNLELTELPAALTSIGECAFYECRKLSRVHIPNSVTSIHSYAFYNVPDLEFLCSAFSYAATFAIDHNIPMVDTEEAAPANIFIDRSGSGYKINGNGLSSAGTLNMVAEYAFNSDKDCTDAKLIFNIPESLTLVENSLTIDGVICTNYEITDTMLTVPVQALKGTVRFQFKPKTYDRFTTYCKVAFKNNGRSYTETIGSVYTELPMLTLSAPKETAKTTMTVSGVTTPENNVTLAVNGVETVTVKSNKVGNFSADIPLGEPGMGDRFAIGASAVSPMGQILSAGAETTYDDNTPELTLFEMTYRGYTCDLLNTQGRPTLVWYRNSGFDFEVKLSNYEQIVSVYITSSRNNVKKYMKATWSEEKESYVASGIFEGTGEGYMPGYIGVEIVRDNGSVSFLSDLELLLSGYACPDAWRDSDCIVEHSDEKSSDFYVDIPNQGDGDYALRYQTNSSRKTNYTEADAVADGYSKVTDDNGKTVYVRESMTPTGMSVSTIDFSDIGDGAVEVSDILIDCYTVYVENGQKVFAPLDALNNTLDIIDILNTGVDTVNDIIEVDKIQTRIKNSDMSEAEKEAAMKRTYQVQTVNMISCFMKIGLTIASSALIVPGLGAWGIVAAASLIIANEAIEMWDDLFMEELYSIGIKWLIDPSGYIYDLETGRRIHGATVTVFWIPCEDPDDAYWSNKPGEETYGTLWNATEYSLCNPQTTNEDGQYGWDVPEGWWRVRCEMAGYETVWSEWLPVPPPQLEVNLGMTRSDSAFSLTLTDSTATSAAVLLENTCCYDAASRFFLAAYDSDRKMVAVQMVEDSLSVGESLPLTVSCKTGDVIETLKLFVLNDDLQPVILPLEKTIPK